MLTVLFAAAFLLSGRAAEAVIPEDFVRQGYDVSPSVNLSVRNTDGRIFIYGSDAPRLEIIAMRRAFSEKRRDAIKIEVSIKGDAATIETIYPLVSGGSFLADRSGTVDYLILVPQTCTLARVELGNGEVLIEGMRGERIEAQLGNGVMHLRNCFSTARVRLERGRLIVRYDWWEARAFSLSAEVADGDLRVAVPAGAALHLDAAAVRGKVINHFAPGPRDVPQLDEHFGGESAVEFKLRTTTGNIQLEAIHYLHRAEKEPWRRGRFTQNSRHAFVYKPPLKRVNH